MMACFAAKSKAAVAFLKSRPTVTHDRWFCRLAALALAALAIGARPVAAAPVDTGHLQAELVAQTAGVAPGGTVYVAIRQNILKGWHTYWRNPGDSGQATTAA